ncbi:hypothetical protein CRE_02430 [Caenorhabditis remanei]|uniref:Uncharacterized protein n=1 Tax=Caenorhabditis remanei TaxID=31234 RepID=E3MIQ4_CAERE|nr:hypothetical protein CRE_02430 [Caenorhabditis remanei]
MHYKKSAISAIRQRGNGIAARPWLELVERAERDEDVPLEPVEDDLGAMVIEEPFHIFADNDGYMRVNPIQIGNIEEFGVDEEEAGELGEIGEKNPC